MQLLPCANSWALLLPALTSPASRQLSKWPACKGLQQRAAPNPCTPASARSLPWQLLPAGVPQTSMQLNQGSLSNSRPRSWTEKQLQQRPLEAWRPGLPLGVARSCCRWCRASRPDLGAPAEMRVGAAAPAGAPPSRESGRRVGARAWGRALPRWQACGSDGSTFGRRQPGRHLTLLWSQPLARAST